jgi:hypothetical protein
MTALIGAAVLGLVPLPSMATSDSWASHRDHWPTTSEAADAVHVICAPRAMIERLATREELARLHHELGDIDADMTRNGFRRAGMKKGCTEHSR